MALTASVIIIPAVAALRPTTSEQMGKISSESRKALTLWQVGMHMTAVSSPLSDQRDA